MTGDRLPVRILSAQLLAAPPAALCGVLGTTGQQTLALISTDCDDATYIALDEATKRAAVDVVYARSLYAGAPNATTALAGEVIGVLAGSDPSEVRSGLQAAIAVLEGGIGFHSAREDDSVVYLAHCVARTGTYLSGIAHVAAGQALAYLVAPPVEAICALDDALKAADVRLTEFFAPPSETNFAGALLAGEESACRAACAAFARAVCRVAARPIMT